MSLSNDLLSQFVKVNKDNTKPKTETTVYGTTVEYEGKTYVRLDGSDLLTPVESTVATKPDERVTVMIKDHTATITGNLSSPSARKDDVDELSGQITELDIVVANKVNTDELNAEKARIDELIAEDVLIRGELVAGTARIDALVAKDAEITGKLTANEADIADLKAEKLDAEIAVITYATIANLAATNANVHNLSVTFGDFRNLTTDRLDAVHATIDNLGAEYANIDFANIGEAALRKIFADSGLIKDIIVSNGTITGELIGVTIKGDLIEGDTIKADKLVVKGSDGLYYKLNLESGNFTSAEEVPDEGLHGSVIIAQSITADRIAVTDLVAFGATIGGFKIGTNSLYSGVKNSIDNTTAGVYFDSSGQAAFGDELSFLKWYKDSAGIWRLAISADSMRFGSTKKSVEDVDTAASNAQTAANDAKTAASNAQTAANDAKTAASNAQSTASNAQSTASNAQTTASNAQTAANDAQSTANDASGRVAIAESTIQQLADSIAFLVTDGAGTSLMTQTANGWTFNMSAINETLGNTAKTLGELSGKIDGVDDILDGLNTVIDDLGEKTAYITMATDDGGNPCIELGKVDNDFKVRITNTSVDFMEGSSKIAYVNNKTLYIEKAVIKDALQIGEGSGFIWKRRSNGNLGLRWIGG